MSRTQRIRPTGAVLATGAVLGAIALAGCGAGQITQTNTQISAVTGAGAGVGAVVVRDAYIEFGEQAKGANIYPRGGAAPLKMSIVNTGIQPDRLVSASSPAAASITISGDSDVPPGRVLLIEGAPQAAAPSAAAPSGAAPGGAAPSGAAPSGAPPAGAASTASARPAPSAAPAQPSGEPGAPGDEIGGAGQESSQAPAAEPTSAPPATPRAGTGDASAGGREGQVVLTGLTEDIRAGLTYPVVLNFERAGQVTLTVPVGLPTEPREDERAE